MLDGIRDLCHFLPPNAIVVEIGCYAGESTSLFMASGKIDLLYAIDPWDADYYSGQQLLSAEAEFDRVLEPYGTKVIKLKKRSDSALIELIMNDRLADMVYIDGDHSYKQVKVDIALAMSVVKPGGIIAGHDYGMKGCDGVRQAVNEMLQFPDVRFADTSWLKFKDRVYRDDRTALP